MGSFDEDLRKLKKTDSFYYIGALIILGLLISVIALVVSYIANLVITQFGWSYAFLGFGIFFLLLSIFLHYISLQSSETVSENKLIRSSKIAGVSILIAIFLSLLVLSMGGLFSWAGLYPTLIVYWVFGIAFLHIGT
jgi:hypothetical protein